MTIEELLEKVPESFRPVVAKYGPALIEMSAAELWAWLELLVQGKTQEAWRTVMERLPDNELLDLGATLGEKWDEANIRNAEKIALQRSAALAFLKVLLGAALALVGL